MPEPNPFAVRTYISYALPKPGPISLRVYDRSGMLVRILKAGTEPDGFHGVVWDGLDEQGDKVGAGVYYYRVEAGDFSTTRKMVKTE